jgi:uncharacterized protein (TIGR02594 family)
MNIKDIQKALKAKSYDPGPIDGVWGRRTIAAVKAFQEGHDLTVDGIVGPKTYKALFGKAQPKATPADTTALVWYNEARRLMGTREVTGAGSNQKILDWATSLGIDYKDDDIAWCGLFVAHCVGATLPGEVLPANPLGARNWSRFGTACQPTLGAVLVFWRQSKTSGLGHVGFYYGEDADTFYVLGGNQSNMVSVARVPRARFLGARRPATVSPLPNVTVQRKSTDTVSTNEA